jgi:uncharacterized protein (TIGR00297 family)
VSGADAPSTTDTRLDLREIRRKAVHMGSGSIAFAMRFLGPLGSLAGALGAVIFNVFLLPRLGGRALLRSGEVDRGRSIGILLYPVAVTTLILVFWRRLEIAAAMWGVLAFGDGMASIVGMSMGRAKLPWNPRKSWAGTFGYWAFGSAAAAVLLLWTAPGRYDVSFAVAIAAGATAFAALLESLPQGLDDNLGVPLVTGIALWGLSLTQGGWSALASDPGLLRRLLIGAGVNALLAGLGWLTGGVSRSGVAAGFLVGTAIWALADWRGYVLLLAFYVLGTACTKVGYARKAAAGIAQEKGGRRGAKNALAKTTVPAWAALFAATVTESPGAAPFAMAFAAAFATAAADTVSSEIGKAYGRRTFLSTTFKPVPRGTEGAVSFEGTLAGVLASLAVAGLGVWSGWVDARAVWILPVASFVANWLEGVVGATLERRGLLDNEAVNFLNTLCGAVGAGLLACLVA